MLFDLNDSTGFQAFCYVDGVYYESTRTALAEDAEIGSFMQLANDTALTNPMSAQLANLKWGVLDAGGISLDAAKWA